MSSSNELASARIGATFNFYRDGPRADRRAPAAPARVPRVARARRRCCSSARRAGYRGARVSGIPFTSERQLTGRGPAEATATIVRRVLAELGIEEQTLLLERRADAPASPGSAGDEPASSRAEVEASQPCRSRARSPAAGA